MRNLFEITAEAAELIKIIGHTNTSVGETYKETANRVRDSFPMTASRLDRLDAEYFRAKWRDGAGGVA